MRSDPSTLLFIPDAIRPPPIHTACQRSRYKFSVLALFRQYVQEEPSGQVWHSHLIQVLQNARDPKVVMG